MVTLLFMGLRGAALVGRFLLSIYLVKYLGLAAMGAFGLLAGAAAIAPPALGFGLGFFLNREIVGKPEAIAARMLRDRLAFSASAVVASVTVAAVLAYLFSVQLPDGVWVAVAIVAMEVLAFDIHLALLSLRRALLANVLLAIRSSAWILPFIGVGLIKPEFRTFDYLLQMWAASLVLMFVVLAFALRAWPWSLLARAPIDRSWLRSRMRSGWLIYASDIGIVGSVFIDRFVINHLLGIQQTGVFVFYWSLANAVQVLVQTSIVQVALPHLVNARQQSLVVLKEAMRDLVRRAVLVSVLLSIAMLAVCAWLLPYVDQSLTRRTAILFSSMLAAAVLRLVADVLAYGLYSRQLDGAWARANIAGFVVSAAFTTIGIICGGLIGAGVALIAVSLAQIAIRLWLLRRADRHEDQH